MIVGPAGRIGWVVALLLGCGVTDEGEADSGRGPEPPSPDAGASADLADLEEAGPEPDSSDALPPLPDAAASAPPPDARPNVDAGPRDALPPPADAPTAPPDARSVPPDVSPPPPDEDGDGVPDADDLCPAEPDPFQRDADGDGLGDACDQGDSDRDGLPDAADTCPRDPIPGGDRDGDGVGDVCDVCPDFIDPLQVDTDGDGRGDPCEVPGDDDADEVADATDVCPHTPDPQQLDRDGDGRGDACDDCPSTPDPAGGDADLDGVGDACDACPLVPRAGTDHLDVDGDGVPACGGDCDDDDPGRAPGLAERCDGLDNDCDVEVDEVFADLGQPCTAGLGICLREGAVRCAGGGTGCDATPAPPSDELCDGLDNDCDGRSDEDVPGCCLVGEEVACGSDVGVCEAGRQRCGPDRAWGPCSGTSPSAEVCNGLDDDCNGETDEGLGNRACGLGVCEHLVSACDVGGDPCDPLAGATPEVCNGLDDDCDGAPDDALPPLVCAGCQVQLPSCLGGVAQVCPVVDALTEICNGLDDDCDGNVDDVRTIGRGEPTVLAGPAASLSSASFASNGNSFLAVWVDSASGTPTLTYRIWDRDGRTWPGPGLWLRLPVDPTDAVVAAMPGGRYGVAWARRMDVNGTSHIFESGFLTIGDDQTFGPLTQFPLRRPYTTLAVAAGPNGFFVYWDDDVFGAIENFPHISGQPFDAIGAPRTPIVVMTNHALDNTLPTMAPTDGGWGLVYKSTDGGLFFQGVDAIGNRIGPANRFLAWEGRTVFWQRLVRQGATFALGYARSTGGAITDFKVQRMELDGRLIGAEVATERTIVQTGHSFVPTPTGFLVGLNTGANLRWQHLNPDGTPVGDRALRFNSYPAGSLSAAASADLEIAGWTATDEAAGTYTSQFYLGRPACVVAP